MFNIETAVNNSLIIIVVKQNNVTICGASDTKGTYFTRKQFLFSDVMTIFRKQY